MYECCYKLLVFILLSTNSSYGLLFYIFKAGKLPPKKIIGIKYLPQVPLLIGFRRV